MMKQSNRWIALSTLGVLIATTFGGLGMPVAQAKHKTWRNLAIAGAAVTGYGLLKHKKGVAIAGGIGTVYAYSRYRKARRSHRRSAYYRRRYGSSYRRYSRSR